MVGTKGDEINWDLARLVFESKADLAIIPVQDVLSLGSEGRMNTPGREEGNWIWRMEYPPSSAEFDRLAKLSQSAGR